MTTLSTTHRLGRLALMLAGLMASASCASELTRSGRSPALLVIDSISAASGAAPEKFGSQLNSDVVTLVEQTVGGVKVRVPTIFNDLGKASLHIVLKDPGTANTPTTPSPINEVTINRYHVSFRRADGRGTQGVDVPYGFDGGVTATIGGSPVEIGFDIVRHQAKSEPPLANLAFGGGAIIISTLADITFYGHDQAGNEVTVTGTISVNFGDFGDPS